MIATLPNGRHDPLQNRWHYNKSLYFMPFLDSENDARGAKKGNKPRVLRNAIVVLLATYRYKRDTIKVEWQTKNA